MSKHGSRWNIRFEHAFHRFLGKFPLLPIGLLAVMSHLCVYAYSYAAWRGLLVAGVLWLLALWLFDYEVRAGFARAYERIAERPGARERTPEWKTPPLEKRIDGGSHRFVDQLRYALAFKSPTKVVFVTAFALVAITMAVKYASALLFVREGAGYAAGADTWAVFWIVSGTLTLAWILFGYRPGAYGVALVPQHPSPRPYLVMWLSVETKNASRDTTTFYPSKDSSLEVNRNFDEFFRGLWGSEEERERKVDGSIAHAWRGVVPHAADGTLRRLYVIASRKSSHPDNLRRLQQCYDAYRKTRPAGAGALLDGELFEIFIVRQNAGGEPEAVALSACLACDSLRTQDDSRLAQAVNDDASAATDAVSATDDEFENASTMIATLRYVERHLLEQTAERPWFYDLARDLAIDITGGQKTSSTVGFVHAYGRPILAQYIRTQAPHRVIYYDVNPQPGPHF